MILILFCMLLLIRPEVKNDGQVSEKRTMSASRQTLKFYRFPYPEVKPTDLN